MRNILFIFLSFMVALSARAEWSTPQVRYWADQQGVTDDTSGIVVSADNGIESGWNPAWGAKPSKAQCEAVDYATALAWCRITDKAKQDDKQSPDKGWDNLSRKERFLLRVCFRLAKQLQPALTLQQFKNTIRADWDATE